MILEVDPSSPLPPYEQIRSQVATMAATGVLPVGARLPSIRQLASDLGLASGTVARAYRELEAEGVVVSRVRHGTTVAPGAARPRTDARSRLTDLARAYAVAAYGLGVRPDQAVTAVERQLATLAREQERS